MLRWLDAQWLDVLQWPAMVASVVAAWLVASTQKRRRRIGFWCFLASNVLWVGWGAHTNAWALIVLQICLAALNVRGVWKAKKAEQREKPSPEEAS